jgi:hypothetical protein
VVGDAEEVLEQIPEARIIFNRSPLVHEETNLRLEEANELLRGKWVVDDASCIGPRSFSCTNLAKDLQSDKIALSFSTICVGNAVEWNCSMNSKNSVRKSKKKTLFAMCCIVSSLVLHCWNVFADDRSEE